MLYDELFMEAIFLGGAGGAPLKKIFTQKFFQNFCFLYLGKVESFRIIIAMRLGALIIFARGGYQIPPPLTNRVKSSKSQP